MPLKGIPYMTGAQLTSTLKAVGVEFDAFAEYTGCFLCGAVFQSPQDRAYYVLLCDPSIPNEKLMQLKAIADRRRDEWRTKHSENEHTQAEHEELARSRDLMTPEAAMKLAPLGMFPLEGSKEMFDAMAEAPRVPDGRIECS
jgi:hypothetical protein